MKRLRIGAAVALVVCLSSLTGCSPPTPEKLCEKAKEKERAECTKGLTEIKGKLDEIDKGLWKDVADCMSKASELDEKTAKSCIGTENMKKIDK